MMNAECMKWEDAEVDFELLTVSFLTSHSYS